MPQGVAENYRFWGEDKTVFVQKTKGCEFWDVDGKKFVDFRLGCVVAMHSRMENL